MRSRPWNTLTGITDRLQQLFHMFWYLPWPSWDRGHQKKYHSVTAYGVMKSQPLQRYIAMVRMNRLTALLYIYSSLIQ